MKFRYLSSLYLCMLATLTAMEFQAGVAGADITPEPQVKNWVTGEEFGKVLDPLLVQVLVVSDGETEAAVVRWDLVDVSESARDSVREAVGLALKIPEKNILVTASHTHSAPWAPVYGDNQRGKENETWWAIRRMESQRGNPAYDAWQNKILEQTVDAAKRAHANMEPVSVEVGRISVADDLYNRRPLVPGWGMMDPDQPIRFNNGKGPWHPHVRRAGTSFGTVDPALSILALKNIQGALTGMVLHVACHPVQIYPEDADRISSDWPGFLRNELQEPFPVEALVLQGCAGDITPAWARGVEATQKVMANWADRIALGIEYAAATRSGPVNVESATVQLPLTEEASARLGLNQVDAEVQVLTFGPIAMVALPGEPLTEIGMAIRQASPFPQTLVLGYSNGNGVHYVGMPGEKARGGYEAGRAGAGTDECGRLLVEAAVGMLQEVARAQDLPLAAFGPQRN